MKKTFYILLLSFWACIGVSYIFAALDSKYRITRVGEVVGETTTTMIPSYPQGALWVDKPGIHYHYKFYLYDIPEYVWDNDEALLYPRRFKYPDGSWTTKDFLRELRNGYIIECNDAYFVFRCVFIMLAGFILIAAIIEYILSKKLETN